MSFHPRTSFKWIQHPLVILLLGIFYSLSVYSQGVGVGNNGNLPFPGAILDVSANTKGVLLPRTDTSSILLPTKGMIIFDTLISSFTFYNGQQWLSLLTMGNHSFWWADQDGDAYGYPFNVIYAPVSPPYYVNNNLDCDDSDPAVGICIPCITNADCDDGNPCTTDSCADGMCVYTNSLSGTPCTLVNGLPGSCDGNGNCVDTGCTGTPPCADGNPCTVDLCVNGVCVYENAPAGTPCDLPNGLPGFCDGNGNCVESECTGTPPCADGNPCTTDLCVNGVCVYENAPAGTPCDLPNGLPGICDGNGNCIED